MPMRKRSRRPAKYTRKSFFVNAKAIGQARRALGVGTDAEAVRVAVDRVVEMEKFWSFMSATRRPQAREHRGALRCGPSSTPASTSVTGSAGSTRDALAEIRRAFVVRHSAVVLSELRRGARTREAARTVARLHDLAPEIWEPTAQDWWEAGRVILTVGDARDWDRSKRRDFQNDALIALTARGHGATVVTANREDFEILGRQLGVRLLVI